MRKERIINLEDDGKQLTFKVKQMSALRQERWINRALMLLANGNGSSFGMGDIKGKLEGGDYSVILKLFGALKYEDIEPLYNELLECCEHIPDSENRNFTTPLNTQNANSIISDFRNLYRLRIEALKVNFDFFKQGENSPNKTQQASIRITKNM